MDEIATGEVWLGQAALGKLLVDELKTSDEYLAEQARGAMSTRCNSSSARACRNASAWPPAWLSTACW